MTTVASDVERVVYADEGERPRSVRLIRVNASERVLTGIEVDIEGTIVDPPAAYLRQHGGTHGERMHVIETVLIKRRIPQVMNLHTGRLEDA